MSRWLGRLRRPALPVLASRLMQVTLVLILIVGARNGRLGVVLTCVIALVVARLPALIERNFRIELAPPLVLWLTTAVFLHAVGTGGIPGTSGYFYGMFPWWDKLTHALSASVVAAAGYTIVRALDEYSDEVVFPPAFTFVFVLLFTMAVGVAWEIVEFLVGSTPRLFGRTRTGFTQGGLENTMLDLVSNTIGAVFVAGFAHVYLTGAVESIGLSLGGREEE